MESLTNHWNGIFQKTDEEKLGWYETDFSQTLKFIDLIPDWQKAKIFVAGVGTSGLIEKLLKSTAELYLNDLSSAALEKAKSKVADKERLVHWLCQDIAQPLPSDVRELDIWFDRAVLHFLTDDNCVEQYFKNVHAVIKVGGYAFFAEFSKAGAKRCAGLDLRQYDTADLEKRLASFELVRSEEYTYINPYGAPRPYTYALFKRVK